MKASWICKMTRLTNRWIKIYSPEIYLCTYSKLTYDQEDIKDQQKEGWIFQYIMLHQP